MQNNYMAHWGKLVQCLQTPMTELLELNAKSVTEGMNQLKEMSELKKPEQMIPAQVELARKTCAAVVNYSRAATEIILAGVTESGKVLADILQETASQTSNINGMGNVAGTTANGGGTRQKQ